MFVLFLASSLFVSFYSFFFSCRRSSVCCVAELRSWSPHVKEGFPFFADQEAS